MEVKIAFLTPEYPHPKTGGAGGIGSSIYNLVRALTSRGVSCTVICYGQQADEKFDDNGITIYRLKNIRIPGLSLYLTSKKIEVLIRKLYKANRINVVEVPDWTGIGALLRLPCPMVVRLHGSDTYFCHFDKRKIKMKNYLLERKNIKKANGHLSVSAFTAAKTNALFDLMHKYRVIPNMVDTDVFLPSGTDDGKTILYFGTLIRKKGVLELPNIFNRVVARHPDAKLVLVGKDASDIQTGSSSTWALMQEIFTAEALERVTYFGAVPYQEIARHIQNAAVCVFPSFAEALPVSWMEAMALEKSIVASNIGWAKEMVDHEVTGFLAHPTAHAEFAEYIHRFLSDENLRKTMGKAAREKAIRDFGAETVATKNIEFYQHLIRR